MYAIVLKEGHVSRPTIWKDDEIFRVNINNGMNGCTFIISSPIAKRPKAFQQNRTLPWDRF